MADIQLILEVIGEQDMVKAINTAGRMKAEYKKLDSTLNENKMSAQQYAKGIQQLDAKYDALTKTTNRLTVATKQQAAAQALAGKRINRMGANLQQVGYQVGDFAVQVQGGTNVMVALGQQGAQLLGIFGAGGALAGAALAISTALIAPLMKAKKEVESLRKEFEDLLKSIEDSNAARGAGGEVALNIARASKELIQLENKIRRRESSVAQRVKGREGTTYENELKRLLDITKVRNKADYDKREALILQMRLLEEQRKAQIALASDQSLEAENLRANETRIRDERIAEKEKERKLDAAGDKAILEAKAKAEKALFDENAEYEKRVAREVAAEKKKKADLDAAGDKAILEAKAKAEKALFDENAKYEAAQAKAAKATSEEIAQGYQKSVGLSQTLTNQINSYVESVAEGFKQSEALKEELGEAAFEALRIAGVDMASGISAAAAEAAKLAVKMGISLGLALDLVALAGKSRGENLFDAKVRTGVLPPQAAGDFNTKGGETPVALKSYMDRVDARVKARGKVGSSGGGSKKTSAQELQEYLDKLQQQADLENQLVGFFGEKRNAEEEVIKARQKYNEVFGKKQEAELRGTLAQIEADKERQRVLEEAQAQQQSIADTLQSSMSDAFMSMVDGTKSFKDAMKDMARAVIKQLFEILVVQRLVGSFDSTAGTGTGIVGAIMGAFQADGGAWQGGSQIQAYANGGIVGGPTMFPMAGGKTGLMGEAGPEAIMPLKRGANGKLGVQMEGGSQGNVVVNQSFNFSANGDESVKKIIAQSAPQIANMTKQSMMNDRRRGGQMKATFG